MKDYFGMLCAWYLNGRSKKQAEVKKKIQDEKLKEVYTRLKQLEEFIKFLNEKAFANRGERKRFWKDVLEGKPVIEDTLKRILSRYGVKDETIKELEKRKLEKIEAMKVAEKRRQLQEAEARRIKDLPYIIEGKCTNEGDVVCNLGYACDGCPYNVERMATKKQMVEKEISKTDVDCADGKGKCNNPDAKTCDDCERCGRTEVSDTPEVE